MLKVNLNWSPLTTTSGADAVKVIFSSAHEAIAVVMNINKRTIFLIFISDFI
jgi:hypothetical protein